MNFAAASQLSKSTSSRYWVLAMLCVCAAIAYLQPSAISVPAREIAAQLRFTDLARQMGWCSPPVFCYGLMQLPSGALANRLIAALWCF